MVVLAFEQENSGGHQKGGEGRSGARGAEKGPSSNAGKFVNRSLFTARTVIEKKFM